MFQFTPFAFQPYVFRLKYLLKQVGSPIRTSTDQSLFANSP